MEDDTIENEDDEVIVDTSSNAAYGDDISTC